MKAAAGAAGRAATPGDTGGGTAPVSRPTGYARAFSLTTRTSHAPAEARLADVTAPALVVMGEQDPGFPDPRAEADWIGQALRGQVVMVSEAGHYLQSQRPDLTAAAVLRILETVKSRT
jgi:pimeloyl-ACP methyl ester carboxylesterase